MNWRTNLKNFLARGVADLSPSCKEATRLQSASLDCKLTLRQGLGLRFHLMLCKWCRRYGKQIMFLRSATQRHGQDDQHSPPQVLSREARERILRNLRINKD